MEFSDGTGPAAITDVLIVGSGPAGAAAALLLSTLDIPNIMITKYRWTANTPRAHITNQRAMEVFRDAGIEHQVLADATPHDLMGDTVFCTSIAGEEIGRILTRGTHPGRHGDYELASPCLPVDILQTYLEPILVRNATERGTQARFAYGVELGQFYESAAIVTDGSTRPAPTRDPELFYEPSTVPGARLPHVWVGDPRTRISTLDLAPMTRFTLLTGIAGESWVAAADKVAQELNVPLETVVIGPGRAVTDLYYDWARVREVEEDGAILVRPDKHIGWRSARLVADPYQALLGVLTKILGRGAA
ncbi:FAD-dependent monooxygenase [Actinoplanes regularis]|uniref:FAD binding domain-containing protein n=1 Tax=Actinoplanes regularis TaxID=52697 RepID=A0A239K4P8_9ACTN|nr:FAD-dependent monooxygenase [Actinoplanes regularis]GIE92393.1 hypothetical protein Are01nite_88730 [Actinoplanes regularis]SNT12609.1 FAD binding domain-containing protein [Actinoplanes regularis]